jgi:hypothetical protein
MSGRLTRTSKTNFSPKKMNSNSKRTGTSIKRNQNQNAIEIENQFKTGLENFGYMDPRVFESYKRFVADLRINQKTIQFLMIFIMNIQNPLSCYPGSGQFFRPMILSLRPVDTDDLVVKAC